MGYCIWSNESNFKIKNENIEKAFKYIREYAKNNKKEIDSFSWVDSDDILKSHSLVECFNNLRWEMKMNDIEDDITSIEFVGEKAGNDLELFNIIAGFVEAGSFIECTGEDGERWRFIFNGSECKEIYPKIIWEVD